MAKFDANRNRRFAADVKDFADLSKKRLQAVMRQSIQDTVDIAQLPGVSKRSYQVDIANHAKSKKAGPAVATTKGGRMRVDTGFLRASGQSSLNGMPTGPIRGVDDKQYQWDRNGVELTLGKLQPGSTFFFGWTAAYAKYREAFDGFLEAAVQQWPQTVANNARKMREMIKK